MPTAYHPSNAEWVRPIESLTSDGVKELQRLQAENAKLRELVRALHYCTSSGECDGCPANSDGTARLMPDDICDTMLDCMRELGVEVE